MPRKRLLKRAAGHDIDVIRDVIRQGIPWLPPAEQRAGTRHLSDEQSALLGHLCPTYKTVMKFLSHCQPDPPVLKAARIELRAEIEAGEGVNHAETSHPPKAGR